MAHYKSPDDDVDDDNDDLNKQKCEAHLNMHNCLFVTRLCFQCLYEITGVMWCVLCACIVEASKDTERAARGGVHESPKHISDGSAHGEGDGKDQTD